MIICMVPCLDDRIKENNNFTILNYQGSKKNLIDFIHKHMDNLIIPEKAFLDIFAGTCAVGYSYKSCCPVYANDLEYYSYLIADSLLNNYNNYNFNKIKKEIGNQFKNLYNLKLKKYDKWIIAEETFLESNKIEDLIDLYSSYPTIWNNAEMILDKKQYILFTSYYAGNYFGIKQAIEIDCLRNLIENIDSNLFSMLISCLFFAMKNCVFSKDGHMAQPLDLHKNASKLIFKRKNSILDNFYSKLTEYFSSEFINTNFSNSAYNMDFENLIKLKEIQDNVGLIYADPPYTDMQYSRYYHLLNIVSKYDYPKPTLIKNVYTKGLYTEGRSQSLLSQKRYCLEHFSNLINFSKKYNKNLAISFAYPNDPILQKTDRYVMSIEEIVRECTKVFKEKNVNVVSTKYNHSNNRNTQTKKVLEYLILCKY